MEHILSVNNKIKNIQFLTKFCAKIKKNKNKKIVLCHGDFDVLHTGHLNYLLEAKKKGDYLIVSVTGKNFINKGPDRPINDDNQRLFFLANLSVVDFVVLDCNPTAETIIKSIKPDFYVKGRDYYLYNRKDDYSKNLKKEIACTKRYGGEIIFTTNLTRSSSNIINNLFLKKDIKTKIDLIKKSYSYENFLKDIESFKNLKILVIGETIIDEYIYTDPLGKPSKENIIAAEYKNRKISLGGVFAAFKTFSLFSNKVDCLTAVSNKTKMTFPDEKYLIKNKKTIFDTKTNTIKTRFVENKHKTIKKIFEVYTNSFLELGKKTENKVVKFLNKNIKKYDILLVNDYGHGFFNKKIINILSKKAKFLCVNAQINAGNQGFNLITKYNKADYYCIDEMEAMKAVNNNSLKTEELMNLLHKLVNGKNICITLGSRGSCIKKKKASINFCPAFTNSIVDTISAGDIFFAISSLFLKIKSSSDIANFFGNVAGSIAVNQESSTTFSSKEVFLSYVNTLFK